MAITYRRATKTALGNVSKERLVAALHELDQIAHESAAQNRAVSDEQGWDLCTISPEQIGQVVEGLLDEHPLARIKKEQS